MVQDKIMVELVELVELGKNLVNGMDSTRDAVRVENIQFVIIPDSPQAYESGLILVEQVKLGKYLTTCSQSPLWE
ncbi:MAG: hypothetical protein HQ534_08080 [Armatimonadetes bacterium]|nr:hypothetical protein [Armatimonadota bacterium]